MDKKIEFITGDTSLLDEIKELWEELNQFHIEKSVDFKNHYKAFTFAARKESIVRHIENGALLVAIAYCNNLKIGYCISSVVDGIGEIDSIFVKTGYRKSDVGHKLMEMSLDWIKTNAAKKIVVKVSVGNEEVFGFYSKYGFAPCLTELQII
ncbi:MAG: GNAT family N-acetyltransferase [Candidatus Gastranaerophilaceae bacterium]|jgi:ribosomal protein S18 acetylase RimI-like enzyme